ncbi:MAG: DUF309 domain-containing protein [Polyangiaceae bacterium]|jgi:hypothetical protein
MQRRLTDSTVVTRKIAATLVVTVATPEYLKWRRLERQTTLSTLVDDSFARGARLFEAHEVWEGRWRVATDKGERAFLQGLIQVAAAFHKLLVMKSPDSASRLLARGLAKLDAYPARVQEMDLAAFREPLRACDFAGGHLTRATIPTMSVVSSARP